MTPSKNRRADVVPSSVAKIQDVSDLFINKKFVADGKGKLAPLQPLKNNFGLPKTVNFSGKKNINGKPSNFTVNATLKFK